MTPAIQDYINNLTPERKEPFLKLYNTIADNLPKGFEPGISYGMPTWCVPHATYPRGYHCDPKQPLPFVSIASTKSHIAVYHMGLYASPALMKWFTEEWPKQSSKKADMGKSCLRFKKPEEIPFPMIGELMKRMGPEEWIRIYESAFVKPGRK